MQEYIWGSGTVEGNLESECFIRAGFIIESGITGTISITANEGLEAADMKVGIVRSRFKLALPEIPANEGVAAADTKPCLEYK